MPTVFRPARPSRRVTGGRKLYLPGAGPIRTTAGASAGVATVAGVGIAIKAAIGSTAGAATVNGVAVAIKAFAGNAAGVASVSANGAGVIPAVGIGAGIAVVDGRKLEKAITSTRIIQKPVDYALAGDQFEKKRLGKRALQHAFNE